MKIYIIGFETNECLSNDHVKCLLEKQLWHLILNLFHVASKSQIMLYIRNIFYIYNFTSPTMTNSNGISMGMLVKY